MERRPFFAAAALAVALIIAGLWLILMPTEKPARPLPEALTDIVLPEARTLEPFSLTDIEGKSYDLSSLKGRWSLLFFGYTHCPDICPTTLSTLRSMARKLEQAHSGDTAPRFVFISVDPKRDKLEHLKSYVSYFHPEFSAATGEKAQIDNLARQLGAIYMFDGDTSGDEYIVNHSASVVVIDPKGRWVARFNPPHNASGMAEDFRRLRDYFESKQTSAG